MSELPETPFQSARRRRLDIALVALVFCVPFLYPGQPLIRAKHLPGADLQLHHLPHQRFIHEHLRVGVIPFWNPYSYGGTPEFGNPEKAPMYPLHFVGLLLLGPQGMLKLKFLFHLGLAGLGCFLLLRALAVPRLIALPAALVLQSSGWHITKVALHTVGDSAAWIPLMLYLGFRFTRGTTLGRGLALALATGTMLLMLFPQINLTLALLMGVMGAAQRVRVYSRSRDHRGWVIMDRLLLPLLEMAVIALMLRYPPRWIPFPEPGWRCAFDGMGRAGLAALACTGLAYLLWMYLRGLRVRVDFPHLWRWALGFGSAWALGALLAAPALAITGEMIPLSNQQTLAYTDEDYFTGAQAYGSVREFLVYSALALRKESVNNMALGPGVYVLVGLGMLVGIHRRRRWPLLLTAGAALTLAVYMAAPGVFDVFRRLPFFSKFAGLSRYQAFLNVFLVLLAALAAHHVARLWQGRARRMALWGGCLLLLLSYGFLLRHQHQYWSYLLPLGRSVVIPDDVTRMIKERLNETERLLVDARERDDSHDLLMYAFSQGIPTLSEYAPMRLEAYDRWERAHNAMLGVNHSDYRAGFWEPAATPWTRALRVRGFLFAPGAPRPLAPVMPDGALRVWATLGQWQLMEDAYQAPLAWPESKPDRAEPRSDPPAGWKASLIPFPEAAPPGALMHRLNYRIHNPGAETWAVFPYPNYPGWCSWVNGVKTPVRTAYGFLRSIPVPAGDAEVRWEYRPLSFALGWLVFLWASWTWIALYGLARSQCGRRAFLALACAGGPLALLVAGRVLWNTPDLLLPRIAEFGVIFTLAWICSWILKNWVGSHQQ